MIIELNTILTTLLISPIERDDTFQVLRLNSPIPINDICCTSSHRMNLFIKKQYEIMITISANVLVCNELIEVQTVEDGLTYKRSNKITPYLSVDSVGDVDTF